MNRPSTSTNSYGPAPTFGGLSTAMNGTPLFKWASYTADKVRR